MKTFILTTILVLCVSISVPSATSAVRFNRTAEAKKIALATWGPVCNGEYVPITKMETGWDGYAYYDDDPSYDDVPPYHNCKIGLLRNLHWSWEKFCTIVVHEFGHLAGKRHVDDVNNVMYPVYIVPFRPCERHSTS